MRAESPEVSDIIGEDKGGGSRLDGTAPGDIIDKAEACVGGGDLDSTAAGDVCEVRRGLGSTAAGDI